MQDEVYVITDWKDIREISLSLKTAQEILMDYAFEAGYYTFLLFVNYYGNSLEGALEEANREMSHFQIWEYNLI